MREKYVDKGTSATSIEHPINTNEEVPELEPTSKNDDDWVFELMLGMSFKLRKNSLTTIKKNERQSGFGAMPKKIKENTWLCLQL